MAQQLKNRLTDELENSMRGIGEGKTFPKEAVEKDRIRHIAACEKSLRAERVRQAKSAEAASKIFINL